jgi:hypothetical protein
MGMDRGRSGHDRQEKRGPFFGKRGVSLSKGMNFLGPPPPSFPSSEIWPSPTPLSPHTFARKSNFVPSKWVSHWISTCFFSFCHMDLWTSRCGTRAGCCESYPALFWCEMWWAKEEHNQSCMHSFGLLTRITHHLTPLFWDMCLLLSCGATICRFGAIRSA